MLNQQILGRQADFFAQLGTIQVEFASRCPNSDRIWPRTPVEFRRFSAKRPPIWDNTGQAGRENGQVGRSSTKVSTDVAPTSTNSAWARTTIIGQQWLGLDEIVPSQAEFDQSWPNLFRPTSTTFAPDSTGNEQLFSKSANSCPSSAKKRPPGEAER